MVRYTNEELQITIRHDAPQELRNNLLQALAAATRWACLTTYKKKDDDESLHMLAELQESIIVEEGQPLISSELEHVGDMKQN